MTLCLCYLIYHAILCPSTIYHIRRYHSITYHTIRYHTIIHHTILDCTKNTDAFGVSLGPPRMRRQAASAWPSALALFARARRGDLVARNTTSPGLVGTIQGAQQNWNPEEGMASTPPPKFYVVALGRCLCYNLPLPKSGPQRDYISIRIIHSNSQTHGKGDARNHGLQDPHVYVLSIGPPEVEHGSEACHATV